MKPERALVVALLATILLLVLVWFRLAAAQTVIPIPSSPAPPIAMLPASGVSGAGTVTAPCFKFPNGTLVCEEAANIIAFRNGVNAQKIRIYKTFTDLSNFQSLDLDVTPSAANITTNWAGTGGAWDLRLENSVTLAGATGQVTAFGGTAADKGTTAGGLVAVRGYGRFTAQTAARNPIATYTVGPADGSFDVSANVLVTTATTHTFTVECAYTDDGNTARVATLMFSTPAAGTSVTSIANANGAIPYMGYALHIRAKAATTITIRTQAAGTYTAVTYNVEGVIKQTAS